LTDDRVTAVCKIVTSYC